MRILVLFIFLFSVGYRLKSQPLFTKLRTEATGLDFVNKIEESDSLHIFLYEYLYNGNGIGVGDFNSDGKPDVFLSGNTVASKLFLNQSENGTIAFKDVTKKAKVDGNGRWATGVSVADVNGDGLLDIYVCHSGFYKKLSDKNNLLYINQGLKKGVPVFKEMAVEAGLQATGSQSTQAAFFDYDRDGDLDMFLLNHSNHSVNPFLNTKEMRSTPNPYFGNRLFENISAGSKLQFKDVTAHSGIVNNALNFGLSVIVADINQDGWPDLYTTSDYTEVDCYYVNNRDGTFTESLKKSFSHVSKFSMGADVGDFNNDGLPDVFTLDMLPEDNRRQKLLKGPDMYDQYHLLLDSGYYHQNMRNMLHLNQGMDAQGQVRFSEIGQMVGISNTDWSWAGLMADFDNDGWKDLLVTNGYLRDFTNMDFLKYTVSDEQLKAVAQGNLNFKTYDLVKKMPSNKLRSYLYHNRQGENGELLFEDVSQKWGFDTEQVSNAAAYADFDGDGDLDLLISNINELVSVYQNSATQKSIVLTLQGEGANTQAYGTKAWVYAHGGAQYAELYPVRGYQSTVTSHLHFGLGTATKADSIRILWPSQKQTLLYDVSQTRLTLSEKEGKSLPTNAKPAPVALVKELQPRELGLDFIHQENDFVDFKVEVLLPYQLSKFGPALAKADVNGDGLEDVFFGGAAHQFGVLYLQLSDGRFMANEQQPWRAHVGAEEVDALFFDANGDGRPDLYVVSGGSEYEDQAAEYRDHLYINRGQGNWKEEILALPAMKSPKECITTADIDGDGDLDLFVGGRAIPGAFPMAARSYILRNDSDESHIRFTDVTEAWSPALMTPGMVTGAQFVRLDSDTLPDLILSGDWMKIRTFKNTGTAMEEIEATALHDTEGLWAMLEPVDIDGDGDLDFVVGNLGRNNQFAASIEKPMVLYYDDFDSNGLVDPIMTYFIGETSFPMLSRDELLDQIPALKKKYTTYQSFADATIDSIFGRQAVADAPRLVCKTLSSIIIENKGDFNFEIHQLPAMAQLSRISGIVPYDVDGDQRLDLFLAGNFMPLRVQLGPCDASVGNVLKQIAPFQFEALPSSQSGFWAGGDVRSMIGLGRRILVGRNDDQPLLFEIK
ncbi:VCBS repeat protein [Dyadobacter jejuensis]|uniref:VCBS repeat protein n=1 Tax=Dyadobacter jejuensis TaxID=1082580 RepID=A0A316ARN4_9BACT|nr:VCBS repeat-containing protein [Dyadobacter jejuensis]PWJ60081.1 VCBS repeat protein [Dyadobacter jejuensis]